MTERYPSRARKEVRILSNFNPMWSPGRLGAISARVDGADVTIFDSNSARYADTTSVAAWSLARDVQAVGALTSEVSST